MQPNSKRPVVVIIGAGFGGITAARTLAGGDVDILVIDRTNHHVFQPLLYQTATAALRARLISGEHRRLAPLRHYILRATHRVGRVHLYNMSCHQPIEEHTDCG
jgi:NADH:ubiquinone reductase (H+-translocating)